MKPPADALKLIEESDMPRAHVGRPSVYGAWLEQILKIPKGQAWIMTEEEAGSYGALRAMLKILKRKGRLPKNFVVRLRTVDGKKMIYIVNSARRLNLE